MNPVTPVDTSSFTPAQLDAFNAAAKLGSGVPTINNAAATPTKPVTPPSPSETQPPSSSTPTTPQLGSNGLGDIGTWQTNPTTGMEEFVKQGQNPSWIGTRGTQNGTVYTDTGAPTLSDQTDRMALAQAQADYQVQAKQVQDTITNIQNGVTPLTAGEQAQVDSLRQQFQTLIDQQTLQNTGAFGTAQMRGYQLGAAEYDPTFQAKTIGSIVSAGQAKVADLQGKEAAAIAQLTQSFKDNDIKAVQDAWSIYQDAAKARQDALQQTIKDTQDAIAAAATAADKQKQYELDLAKFKQTGDQNAFDNALKAEQEKLAEANAAEAKRHNQATEALAAFNAGMGAGGGNAGGITSAQLTPSGAPDPVSQAQVLSQIAQKYGPMTATAIQGLANYSLNPADWSSRAGTKGLSRAQAVALAQQLDPTYNDTNYPIRAAYLKSISSTQSGTVGSAVNAANKSVNHLTSFINTMGKLQNVWTLPIIGDAANALHNATTFDQNLRKNISVAKTEGLGVAEELAKFFKGSGTVDVASIDAWKSQLSTNASPAEVRGLAQGAITLLAGQLETLAEQYQTTMGKMPETDFLNASARANLSDLKNKGYTVDIPGIYYTDKAAYMKADPNAQANMTAAVTALTNAGLPVTPENILQAAQSL